VTRAVPSAQEEVQGDQVSSMLALRRASSPAHGALQEMRGAAEAQVRVGIASGEDQGTKTLPWAPKSGCRRGLGHRRERARFGEPSPRPSPGGRGSDKAFALGTQV
jgi:hypothetical protein